MLGTSLPFPSADSLVCVLKTVLPACDSPTLSVSSRLASMSPRRGSFLSRLICLLAHPLALTSSFDKDLMYQRGYAMGEEFKGKGVHVALGPMTNMGRVAAGGRNWEGFGADPYLSGWATEMTVKGMQDAGVQAW